MAAYGPSSVRFQIEGLQAKPVLQKCSEVKEILNRTSTKELNLVFPALLNSIFGGEGEPGWGLDKLSKSSHLYEFEALRNLLAPEGPLLTTINNLLADPYATYSFPFRCLPGPPRHAIEEGGMPMFYINKLQTHGFSVPTVYLNAFEMYMFCFSYALVSPSWQQGATHWLSRVYDWLYPTLVDDYLTYFLPLDGKDLPALPAALAAVRSPVHQLPMSGRQIHRNVSPAHSQRASLFKPSFTLAHKQQVHASSVLDNTEGETWRSEVMLQIFVEFWLNQNSLVADIPTFQHGNIFYYGQRSGDFNYLFMAGLLQEHFMPSLNHMLVVRMMVKYLHYFTNTATTIITPHYQHRVETPLHHFKRTVVPQTVQKKLYWFLRHAFDRWPHDCYFRLVMETWLSYIQPWRYTDPKWYANSKVAGQRGQDTRERAVDMNWQQFIGDNLLFYTVLFNHLLPRLSRMDFTLVSSAYLLFRLMKVYSTPNLRTFIIEAENELCGMGMPFPLSHTAELGGSYLSDSRLQPPAPSLPPAMMDMEVVGYQYQRMFCEQIRHVMNSFLMKAAQAHATIAVVPVEKVKGIWAWLQTLFDAEDRHAGSDALRTRRYLEQAGGFIAKVFGLQVPEWLSEQEQSQSLLNDSSLTEEDSDQPDCIHTPEGPRLTARGRYQIINNQRRFQNWQTTDPDLQPIRSYENATLVRLLHRICSSINSHFMDDILRVYQRRDFLGRLAKVFLAPPLSPKQEISSPVSFDTAHSLRKPRFSLRVLASYQTLSVLLVVYLLLYMWMGTGPLSFLLLLGCGLVLYGVVCAILRPVS